MDSSPWLCRGGLPRPPVVSIVDLHYRLHKSLTVHAQKKRRMQCIVVSCLSAVFQRLMLVDYQIGLNFASGVGLCNVGEMDIESAIARFSALLCARWIITAYEMTAELCRIRRTYIHNRHGGRAWQPSTTRTCCGHVAHQLGTKGSD